MKAILKRAEVEHDNIISVRIELFGLTVYESQWRDERSPEKTPSANRLYPISKRCPY